MKGIAHVIFSIVFGLVAVAGIVWGIWYEWFAGEEPKMKMTEEMDESEEAGEPEVPEESVAQ